MRGDRQLQATAEVLRFDPSDALLRKVMENAATGMAVIGVDRRLLYGNAALAEMLGYAVDEMLGRDVVEFVHVDDDSLAIENLHNLIAGRRDEYRGECRMLHRDGDSVWVLASASLLRSETTGRPVHVIWQGMNIERQKQAEVALARSESRWNFALEAAGQGVWDHYIPTDDMFYSRTWRTMRGYGPDEYVDPDQQEWLKRIHADDLPRIVADVDKQDHGEAGYETMEYRERHRDGHYIWILSRGRPVEWDESGNRVRTIGTDTDITRLKNAEAALAEEKERLRVTLESIGDGVISTDPALRITFMNPVAERMTGWSGAEAAARPLAEVFAGVDEATGAPVASPVAACLARGDATYLEDNVVLVARDGERRDIRASAAPLQSPEGRAMGAVLVFQDVTASRTLQKQLAHSASHDALTGMPNRAAFEHALVALVEDARRDVVQHALCFLDLDRFKAVNDSAGHAAGDALLQRVAALIRRCCRRNDFAARIGGDEFALLLPDCPESAARGICGKLVAAIADDRFEWEGGTYTIGACVGVAAVTGTVPPAELMSRADAACYAAKADGRGRVVVYDPAQV